jgi:hypothetical protein
MYLYTYCYFLVMMLFGSVGLGNKNVRMNSKRASERERQREL